MRIAELSARTGVPVATIKFYLREALLPSGDSAGPANQATYSERHVHRLHLVRTLLQVGGLTVAAARNTVRALESPTTGIHELLGMAHGALPGPPAEGDVASVGGASEVEVARSEVRDYLEHVGWGDAADGHGEATLIDALVALRRLGRDVGPEVFAPYLRVVDDLAEWELASLDPDVPAEELLEYAIIGTVVFESVLIALRRLAHARHSRRRFDAGPGA